MEKNAKNTNRLVKKLVENPYNYAKSVDVDKLVETLETLSYYYYNTGESLVSDEIYDILLDILKERDPTNEYLYQVGAPISKEKVKLPYYMPSLDKIKPNTDELEKWKLKYGGPYILSDKLDGVSGLIYKDKNNQIKMFTRGDGKEGQDISYLVKYVFSKKVKFNEMKIGTTVRGELIISKKNFIKIENEYKNGRNAVAGVVNSKNYSEDIAKLIDFVAYSLIYPPMKKTKEMEKLENMGFIVVNHIIKNKIDNDLLSKYLMKRRDESDYEVDGIVVYDDSKKYSNTKKNPSHAFAFKTILTDQIAEVKVLEVEWNCSMHGFLKPRVRIEPVTLVGVEIQYATAFNAKFVKDNKIGPGAVIKLVRSGDVIPHILEVLKPSASGKPQMPDIQYKWNKSNVDILVKDIHGACKDAIKIKQITNFFRVMSVKYISEGIVTKLVDNGYDSIIKILKANKDDLYDIDGIGEILVNKIFDNIKKSFKNASLEQVMASTTLFGKGFGKRKMKMILNVYPNILEVDWTINEMTENIKKIEGFDILTANQFASNLSKFKSFYNKLKKVVDLKHLKYSKSKSKSKTEKFKNQKIVFTGVRDKDLEKLIENEGGKVTTTVSKNTTILIYSDKSTSKYIKAKKLNIPTFTLEEFKEKYNI